MNPSPSTAGHALAETPVSGAVRTENSVRWPYSPVEYAKRILWRLVYFTLWKVCCHRVYQLRSAILWCFGARLNLKVGLYHSTWVEMPWDFSAGDHTTIGPRTIIYNLGGVSIGERTVISQDVYVCGGTHDFTDPTYPLIRRKVTIGSHVWIAAGAFIGPGVTIGDGAVVGARAVVVKDVEPWTVVAGNPARVLRRRELKNA